MTIKKIDRAVFVAPDNSQIYVVQRSDVLNFLQRKIAIPEWGGLRFARAKICIEEIDGKPDSLWVTDGEYERCDPEGLIFTKYMAEKFSALCRLRTPTPSGTAHHRARIDERFIQQSEWRCNRQVNSHLFDALCAHFLTSSETPYVKRSSDNPSFLRRKLK